MGAKRVICTDLAVQMPILQRCLDANNPVESLASSLRDGSLFSSLEVTDFDWFLRSRAPWATSLRYRRILQEAHSLGASRRVATTA